MFLIGWNHELCRVPYGTLENLGGGTDECHMALLVGKGLTASPCHRKIAHPWNTGESQSPQVRKLVGYSLYQCGCGGMQGRSRYFLSGRGLALA